MKRFLFVLCSFLFAATALPLHAQPKLHVEGGTKLDFGTILRGDVVDRKVRVKNNGTDTLVLNRVVPSCGCTGAVASGDHIPPGKSGMVEITFNSANFTGQVHKTVTIETNVPDSPRTVVEFTANIIDEITLTPAQCFFKDAQVGKTVSLTIEIKNMGKESFRLTEYRTKLEGFNVELPTGEIKPGETTHVVTNFTPSKVVPVIYDALFINTSNPHRSELYIPIYGNVTKGE